MKKLLAFTCIISFFANGALALAFNETCLHKVQEQAQVASSGVSDHDSVTGLDKDKPCHDTGEINHSDRQHCDRSCLCVHGVNSVPIFDFDSAHTVKIADPIRLRFSPLVDAPAFFGQTPPERPPKSIS